MTTSVELTGLDAQNPLAFFAALGLLRVLDDDARRRGHERPRLAFIDSRSADAGGVVWASAFDDLVGIVL